MNWTRTTELSEEQKNDLHKLYRNEWWTNDRTREGIETVVDESDEIVAFCAADTDELIAFTRVLTDYVYKALVFDVIVATEHRGTGLGRRVMEEVLGHPALSQVEHFELYCLEGMVSFYEQWGFSDDMGDLRLLRREP